jgi:hypothetical protein
MNRLVTNWGFVLGKALAASIPRTLPQSVPVVFPVWHLRCSSKESGEATVETLKH